MDNLQLKQVPVVKTGMLIRKPVKEVFEAFVDPDIATNSGSTRAVAGSRPANRFSGIGNVWHLVPVNVKAHRSAHFARYQNNTNEKASNS